MKQTDDDPVEVCLIGVDAAVDPRNNALARAILRVVPGEEETVLGLREVCAPATEEELHGTLLAWIVDEGVRRGLAVVICIDAPLGWPDPLGAALRGHHAGAELSGEPNDIFRRHTDRDIQARVGKTPLDVGADRIARAAHRTLRRLARVRRDGGITTVLPLRSREIAPTALGKVRPGTVILLETYPAGWMASEQINARGYRPAPAQDFRRTLFRAVRARAGEDYRFEIDPGVSEERLSRRADDLDAVICLLAGVDAIIGRAPEAPGLDQPELLEQVRREGWVWCKSPRS